MRASQKPGGGPEVRAAVRRAVGEVSDHLGNAPAVCRGSYIAPRVVERFAEGATVAAELERLGEHGVFGHPATRGTVERAVLDLLEEPGRPRRRSSPHSG
ncbi:hypothetical protein [Streptomyces sp. NPDC093795]|uniref:hypothetical protein n=1 Tax=Streptomyces sp. NPDC093795 TaxID=3366051 RepID=UPI0037F43D75